MTVRRVTAWLALLLASAGCGSKDRTPEGAVERFLHAAQDGDAAEVYRLLTPSSQHELQEKARLAHAQAAGRLVKPEHLLAVGREMPRLEVTQIRAISVAGDRAQVSIASLKKGLRETLQLERVNGLWRVRLPQPLKPATPASQPATQPATRPASAPASRPLP